MHTKMRIVSAAAALVFCFGMTALPEQPFFNDITASAYITDNDSMMAGPLAKSSYTSTEKSITINWDTVTGAKGYYIYRWSENAPAWIKIGNVTKGTSYTDNRVKASSSYKYSVLAYKTSGSKKLLSSRSSEINATTAPGTPEIINYSADTTFVTLNWTLVNGCTGYEVFIKEGSGDWKRAAAVSGKNTLSCDVKKLKKETTYQFKVRAVTKDKLGKAVNGQFSGVSKIRTEGDFPYTRSSQYLIDRLYSASLKPGMTAYNEINAQGDTNETTKKQLSKADIETVKKFVDSHKGNMTNGEFVDYTLQWLHYNISYADGVHGPDYSEIWGRTHVDNCFNHKVGQCVQYNSALCAVMRYLGYEANVIQGYRYNSSSGSKWQHFWCEVKINGTLYVMDTYNQGTDGTWFICCSNYDESVSGWGTNFYMKNGKPMGEYRPNGY